MVTIVIPAFNEAKNIGRVLSGLFELGFTDCIVVDDGSTDATAEIARSFGANVIEHRLNRGQGAALETGTQFAVSRGAKTVVHFDADGQFNPADIPGALELLAKKGLDVVLGTRFVDGRSKLPWTKQHVLFPLTRLLNRLLTGLRLTDGQNGFRVLGVRALGAIRITYDGMAHNSEILKQIKQHGLRYQEYPVEVRYHRYGQGIGGGLRIVADFVWRLFD